MKQIKSPLIGQMNLLILFSAVIVFVSFCVGHFPIHPSEIAQAVFAGLSGGSTDLPDEIMVVLWKIRAPRIFGGLLVGAALAAAGCTYQSMFRNPLVSPGILGISAGSGLGASLATFLGLPVMWIQIMAFGGGLAAVGGVWLTAARVRRHDPVLVLVLAGVAVGTLLGAGISILKIMADPSMQLPAITFWLMGGLNAITPGDLVWAGPLVLLGLVPMVLLRWRINLMSLSDEEATTLGINIVRMRLLLVVSATLITAAAVTVAGVIGWVGLVVPHMARLLVGPEFSRLLPASLLIGATFVVGADTLARTAFAIELPLGILTALVGAPVFLWLLGRTGRIR